jgi:FeS assembly SUF system regulator
MLRISKLTDYGTVVLAELARAPALVHKAVQLARRTHLPPATVSKVLKMLARGGLVVSHRGPQGGYALARSADSINAAQIIDALEGPVAITECSLESGLCTLDAVCSIGRKWREINGTIRDSLESVSLADLADPSSTFAPVAVAPEGAPAIDP